MRKQTINFKSTLKENGSMRNWKLIKKKKISDGGGGQ